VAAGDTTVDRSQTPGVSRPNKRTTVVTTDTLHGSEICAYGTAVLCR
jgi:hypothetical protein